MKIVLDAGHNNGENRCPMDSSYSEGTTMGKYRDMLEQELKEYSGVDVVYAPRSSDLAERGESALGADCFLSLHTNAAANGKQWYAASGVTIYGSHKYPTEKLAKEIGTRVASVMGNEFRGIRYRDYMTGNTYSTPQSGMTDYYGVIRGAASVKCKNALIVEHGFHTNKNDVAWLKSDDNLRKMAVAEAEAIAKTFGLSKKSKPVPTPAPQDTLGVYVVQDGDSPYSIGKKFGIPWETIVKLNGIASPYTIYTGQKLKLTEDATLIPSAENALTAGSKLSLSNVAIYIAATANEKSGTKSGTYYIWDDEAIKNRIRITNSLANVGKSGQVTGWISADDARKSLVNTTPYKVKVTANALNIRKGAGTNYASAGIIKDKGVYTIIEESAGQGSDKGWGLLKSKAGWISLDFCTKV